MVGHQVLVLGIGVRVPVWQFTTMQYKIFSATPTDSEAINNIYYSTWISTYPSKEHAVSKEDIEDMLKSTLSVETLESHKKWLSSLPDDVRVYVAKDINKVIGFCYVKKGIDNENNKLRAIYVDSSYQGKGIGKLLWNAALDFLDLKKETDVQVVAYNDSAIKFYEQLGFIDDGIRTENDEDFRLKSGKILPLAYLKHPADNYR